MLNRFLILQTAEDWIMTLLMYGFARLTSKNINAITKMVKSLRVFQAQFRGGEDYEFTLPNFVDDCVRGRQPGGRVPE